MLVCVQPHRVGQEGAWLVCGVPGVQAPWVWHGLDNSVRVW